MIRCRADIVRRADRLHRTPRLRLPQYPDYLLFTESTSFHGFLLLLSFGSSPVLSRPLFREQASSGGDIGIHSTQNGVVSGHRSRPKSWSVLFQTRIVG